MQPFLRTCIIQKKGAPSDSLQFICLWWQLKTACHFRIKQEYCLWRHHPQQIRTQRITTHFSTTWEILSNTHTIMKLQTEKGSMYSPLTLTQLSKPNNSAKSAWEVRSCSVGLQKLPVSFGTQQFINTSTTVWHLSLYSDPEHFNPHPFTLFKIHPTSTLTSMARSYRWFPYFMFADQNFVCISHVSHVSAWPIYLLSFTKSSQ
jgi:hypothetical protein